MNYKRFLITSTFMSLISFLPGISFSDPVHDSNINGNFYISGKYMPSFSHFGVFSAKHEKNTTHYIFGLKQDWGGGAIPKETPNNTFNVSNYLFKYENNPFLGFAGAIGYSMDGPRIELEVSYETFDVKNQGNNYKNEAHRYCALHSGSNISSAADTFVYLKNDGLSDISFMLNACYDITAEGIPFSPYICAGIGTDLVYMFEITSPKISYQGKLGLSYSITPEASVFIGGHFHKLIGSEFKDIPAKKPSTSTLQGEQFAAVTLNVCHFGIELGGRFAF